MRTSNVIVYVRKYIKGDEDNQKSYEKRVKLTTSGFFEDTKNTQNQDGSLITTHARYLRFPKILKINEKDLFSLEWKNKEKEKEKPLNDKLFRVYNENDATFYHYLSLELWEFFE